MESTDSNVFLEFTNFVTYMELTEIPSGFNDRDMTP